MINKLLVYLKRKGGEIEMTISIGQIFSYITFKYIPGIGKSYTTQKKAIYQFEKLSIPEKKDFIFRQFYPVFRHAYENIPFYNRLYTNAGIKLDQINSFEDILKLPVISKEELRTVPLEDRGFPVSGRTLVNTGGSSGKPFAFYMDPCRFGNEWAHIHY